MQFIRKPIVVVEEDSAARAQATMLAEDRGRASGTVTALGTIAVLVLLLLVGYFAWWVPTHSDQPAAQVIHDTQVIEKPVPSGSTTIVNNPPATVINPPTVVEHNHTVPVPVPVPDTSGADGGGTDSTGSTGATGNGSTGN